MVSYVTTNENVILKLKANITHFLFFNIQYVANIFNTLADDKETLQNFVDLISTLCH